MIQRTEEHDRRIIVVAEAARAWTESCTFENENRLHEAVYELNRYERNVKQQEAA